MKPAKITPRKSKATGIEKKPRATGVERKPRATGIQRKPRAAGVQKKPRATGVEKKPRASCTEKKPMATDVQKKPRVTEVQTKHMAGEVQMEHKVMDLDKEDNSTSIGIGVNNSIKRPCGQRCYATGPDDPVLAEIHQGSFSSNAAHTSGPQFQVQDTHFPSKTTKTPPNVDVGRTPQHSFPNNAVHASGLQFRDRDTHFLDKTTKCPTNLDVEKSPQPSAKIKLQLFPIDECTRTGLEKDGYHPYLELTLNVRKKVSSILKHLTGKWGTSTIAFEGEPVLFPYNLSTDSTGSIKKWTSNDTEATAGDVYAAIGRPATFCLRYGWLCGQEPNSFRISSMSITFKTCKNFVNAQGDRAHIDGTNEKERGVDRKGTKLEQNKVTEEAHAVMPGKAPLDAPVSALWDDGLTNISIGGLLSEASMQGRFNNCDPKSNQSNWSLPPSQLISDSLDAFLTSQVQQSQGSMLVPRSILDNEQTCHAFSFQKASPLCKDSFALDGRANCGNPIVNAVSKSVNGQVGVPQDGDPQEAKTHLPLLSEVYNDDSSLGLRAFLWDDSRGAFGLGL